jgi:hypothetical protein
MMLSKPRCRYDRFFYRKANKINKRAAGFVPKEFKLQGLERVDLFGRQLPFFCSDHWAIQCYFDQGIN